MIKSSTNARASSKYNLQYGALDILDEVSFTLNIMWTQKKSAKYHILERASPFTI